MLEEFKLSNFGLRLERPAEIVEPGWSVLPRSVWGFYRVGYALLLVAWAVYDFIVEWHGHYQQEPHVWFLFATNWAFLLLVITHLTMAMATLIHGCDSQPSKTHHIPGYKFIWILYEISATSILTTSIIYCIALRTTENKNYKSLFSSEESRLKHGLNAVLILLDLLVSRMPIRLLHGVYAVLFGLTYTAFSYIYYAVGGRGPYDAAYIYVQLDWSVTPAKAIVAVLCTALTSVLIHFALNQLVVIRNWFQAWVELGVRPDCAAGVADSSMNAQSQADQGKSFNDGEFGGQAPVAVRAEEASSLVGGDSGKDYKSTQ